MCIICFATHTSISILAISIEKTTTICPVREHGKSTKPYISPQYFHVCVVHEVLTLLLVADTGPYYMLLHCKIFIPLCDMPRYTKAIISLFHYKLIYLFICLHVCFFQIKMLMIVQPVRSYVMLTRFVKTSPSPIFASASLDSQEMERYALVVVKQFVAYDDLTNVSIIKGHYGEFSFLSSLQSV